MSSVKTAALARHNAPTFGAVHGLAEVLQLRKLPGWMRWLFMEIRMLSDFRTGQVETSWAVLRALMDCDAGERGGPKPFIPSIDQLRRAVQQLESLGLVTRNGQANQGAGRLFLHVLPVVGIGAPAPKPAKGSARVRKPRPPREKATAPAAVPPGVAPGDSTLNSITPKPSIGTELCTGITPDARGQAMAEFRARRGGQSRPPKGG